MYKLNKQKQELEDREITFAVPINVMVPGNPYKKPQDIDKAIEGFEVEYRNSISRQEKFMKERGIIGQNPGKYRDAIDKYQKEQDEILRRKNALRTYEIRLMNKAEYPKDWIDSTEHKELKEKAKKLLMMHEYVH